MITLLDNSKKKKILKMLNKAYGIEKLPHLFLQSGKDKIRIFSGSLSKEEIRELSKIVKVDSIGMKICNLAEESVRLNYDALNFPTIKEQITENIQEINESQLKEWMAGNDLQITPETEAKFIVIKHKNQFYGIARNQGFLKNYIPKERRIR